MPLRCVDSHGAILGLHFKALVCLSLGHKFGCKKLRLRNYLWPHSQNSPPPGRKWEQICDGMCEAINLIAPHTSPTILPTPSLHEDNSSSF